ncbi:MAG: hypothetical protein ACOC41_02410 [Chitinivibrionales bacterium]
MSSEDLFEDYFDDAMKIHALCADAQLPDSDAKLMTYIHVKALESGRGLSYFEKADNNDQAALQFLLGERELGFLPLAEENTHSRDAFQSLEQLPHKIAELDGMLTTEHGIENPFSSELRERLRLYKDSAFRAEKLQMYREHVCGKISSYNRAKVRKAFRAYRVRKEKEEQELMEALKS